MSRKFRRPANGHFAHYCGECPAWVPCEDERLQGQGVCRHDEKPSGVVSFAYYLTHVCKDEYEGACPLFETEVRRGQAT